MIRKWLQPLGHERKQEVLDELDQASSPGFDYFLLVTLSCSIATFGLITNSVAVIIGAMLVAPLMSPILGLSLASVAGEQRVFRKAAVALVEGSLAAVALSTLLGLIARVLPLGIFNILPSEILARTHPSPFDLGIGLAGGAAAAYALAQPRLSAALPGVAIATALMPPLCTVGIGISLGSGSVAFGAFLLFLTNLAAISFAGIVVFAALGFRPQRIEDTWHSIPKSLFLSAGLTLIITVPLIILTLRLVGQAQLDQEVRQVITSNIVSLPDAQLVDVNIDASDSSMHLLVTLRTSSQPAYVQVVALQSALATRLHRTIALQLIVVPTTKLDPLVPPTATLAGVFTSSPTSTLTSTRTNTPTPTFTTTFTPTPTFTPTLVLAYIANTGGKGFYLWDAPAGRIVFALPEGAPVRMLSSRTTVNGRDWIEIQDELGRTGWVQAFYLIIKP